MLHLRILSVNLVELDVVLPWTWTKDGTSTDKQWVLDGTSTGTTCTLLLLDFARRTCDLSALLGFVCTLALRGEVTLHIQINGVIVGLDAEDSLVQLSAGGLLAF